MRLRGNLLLSLRSSISRYDSSQAVSAHQGCCCTVSLKRALSSGIRPPTWTTPKRGYTTAVEDVANVVVPSAADALPTSLPSWTPKPRAGDTVYIAMSGGVDSSVVALLLSHLSRSLSIPAPLHLRPIYMRNWSTLEESSSFQPGSGGAAGCQWQQDWKAVESVCRHLSLPTPSLIDLTKEYWRDVFAPSLDDWAVGLTPNPDVLCNREIKFGALLDHIVPLSVRESSEKDPQGPKSWLATGHYAKLTYPDGLEQEPHLHRATHRLKDQSYFLSSVPASSFSHALFPLAGIDKSQVRELARRYGLPTADKKESMGLCFVGKRGKGQDKTLFPSEERIGSECRGTQFATRTQEVSKDQQGQQEGNAGITFGSWLSSYLPTSSPYTSPGPFLSLDGKVLGHHRGLHTLTIGQGARLPHQLQKWFVARKEIRRTGDACAGTIQGQELYHPQSELQREQGCAIVVPGSDHPLLVCTAIHLPFDAFQWISREGPPTQLISGDRKMDLLAQVRHRNEAVPCVVTLSGVAQDHERDVDEVSGTGAKVILEVHFGDSDIGVEESSAPASLAAGPSATKSTPRRPSAICPGQVLALYQGSRCLGSAVIPAGAVRLLGETFDGAHGGEVDRAAGRQGPQEGEIRHPADEIARPA